MNVSLLENNSSLNATMLVIEGYRWPVITLEHLDQVRQLVAHFLLFTISIMILQKCFLFKLARSAEHAFYCTMGQVLCVTEGVILSVFVWHMALGTLALVLGSMGIIIQMRNKTKGQRKHFQSKHALIGLIGSLFLVGSVLSGFLMALYNLPKEYAFLLHLTHRFFSIISYVALMSALSFSYGTSFVHRNWERTRINFMKFSTLILTIITSSPRLYMVGQDAVYAVDQYLFSLKLS